MPLCAKSMIMNEVKRYFSLCRLKQNKATTAFNAITVLLKNYLQQRIYHHWWPASPWTVLAESSTNVCINCLPGGIEKVLAPVVQTFWKHFSRIFLLVTIFPAAAIVHTFGSTVIAASAENTKKSFIPPKTNTRLIPSPYK